MRGPTFVFDNRLLLFYDAASRAGATALMEYDSGDLRGQHEYAPGSFGAWTHVVAGNHFVLFYDAATRAGATAVVDEGANLVEQHEYAPGSFGAWTHITGAIQVA